MWHIFRRIVKVRDIRHKLLFTAGILLLVRVLDHIPVPLGLEERHQLLQLAQPENSQHGLGQLFSLFDAFSGGSLQSFSMLALSIYPYITATIVMSLLQPIIPALNTLTERGEEGRQRLSQITRIITIPLAFLQAISVCALYHNEGILTHFSLLDPGTMLESYAIILMLIAGVMLLIWLGELITEKGIGNGISLIILGGIIVKLPQTLHQSYLTVSTGSGNAVMSIVLSLVLGVISLLGIVYMYKGQRRVPIQYPTKSRHGRDALIHSARTTYIPLQINSAGMIPLIFASSMLIFPATLAQYFSTVHTSWLQTPSLWLLTWILTPSSIWYWCINAILVFAFTYFYAYILWQQQNLPEKLQRQGAFVTGYRPGHPTALYLLQVLNRITAGGALFLAVATIIPILTRVGSTVLLNITSLIIVVGVVLDTMKQLEAEMEVRNYTGFLE